MKVGLYGQMSKVTTRTIIRKKAGEINRPNIGVAEVSARS